MEYQAIELVNRGQVAEAIRLLESEKYWKEKGIYQQGLANFLKEKGSDYSLAASSTEEAIRLAIAGVQSVVATSQAITIIIVLASVLLAFLIINFFSRFIINPLGQLRLDAEKIKQGDFSFEVRVAGEDEIGELSQAFNLMTEAVRHSQASIEQKVAEQTAEVDKKAEELADQKKAILNVLEDIQEEKQKTAKERDKIDTILRSIGDGVFAVDKNFKILVFNEVAAKISGYSVAEALGRPYQEVLNFVLEKDGKINDKFLKDSFKTGKVQEMTNHTLLVRKDGGKVPVADLASPLKDEKGKIVGYVVVFRDVTKEREIDRMKTEFVSVASHQLRTPLTGIKWFAELLMKNKLDATSKDYVKQIAYSNDRMVRLVDNLLNVSRIETGRKFDLVLKNTDIVPIVAAAIKEQLPSAAIKHVSLTCAANAPDKLVLAIDELKIRQVFQNLISNAIKYTKEKGAVVVGCEHKKKEVVFYVKDNGVGIPLHQQHHVFSKFFRGENVLALHTDGTGLGLYIVKAIVAEHGGQVWFESEENKGTTFFVSLPVKLIK